MITESLSRFAPGTFAGRIMRLPLHLIPRNTVVRVRSGLNEGLRWVVGSSIHGCWLGHYERDKQSLLANLVKPGMIAFDIGANAGFYSLALSRLVGPSGHVWAFEPFGENSASLQRHLTLNSITNVTLVQAAVSETSGLIGFDRGANNATGKIANSPSSYLVPTFSLDALIASGRIPTPDIVKMDVEGAETQVLHGARNLLATRAPLFLVALHGSDQVRACFSLLADAGYRVLGLDGALIAPNGDVSEIYAVPQ